MSDTARPMTDAKRTALDWIETSRAALSEAHMTIWRLAEPAWREYRSCAWYVEQLRREGFRVEEGSAGMPTAFCATWGEEGPVLGGYAEYDAVPGRTQAPVPYNHESPAYAVILVEDGCTVVHHHTYLDDSRVPAGTERYSQAG